MVEIEELPQALILVDRGDWLTISENRSVVTIKFSMNKYYDINGKETSVPSPQSVLESLNATMKKAVEEYNKVTP